MSRNKIALLAALCFGFALFFGFSSADPRTPLPPFDYAYAVVTYSCEGGSNIAVFSQVFAACYEETNHSQIVEGQVDAFKSIAAASCGAEVNFAGQRISPHHPGVPGEATANEERANDVHQTIAGGTKVESAVVEPVSSSKCQ
jgi:hypothetical protein